MRLTRCENGHFFDAEKYTECPHCGQNKENNSDAYDAKLYFPEQYKELGHVTKVGHGSVSIVYKISGEKNYAVKAIVCEDDNKYHRALQEIKIMESLAGNDSAVQIRDTQTVTRGSRKIVYILEEYLETFSDYMNSSSFFVSDVLKVVIDICEAAIGCRNSGVLHLDIQPKNIFFRKYGARIVLGDFSSSLFLTECKDKYRMRGTIAFMAPEVYRDGICSEQSDIYSIGIILYCLLNEKRLPFSEENIRDVAIYKRLAGTPLPVFACGSNDKLKEIEDIIYKSCAYDRRERFQSFEELQLALKNSLKKLQDGIMDDLAVFKQIPNIDFTQPFTLPFSQNMQNTCSRGEMFDADAVATSVLLLPSGRTNSEYLASKDDDWSFSEEKTLEPADDFYDGDPVATSVAYCDSERKNVLSDDLHKEDFGVCRACGTVFVQETNYCPFCGTKVLIEKPKIEISKVHFSAVVPKTFIKGEYTLIDIVMYEDAFRSVVEELISNADTPVKETRSGTMKAPDGAMIRIRLSSPDVVIEDDEEEQEWQKEYLNFTFAVMLPENYVKRQILFTATVYINHVIATRLKFIAKCSSLREQKIKVLKEDILSAFVSYASQDRHRVAMIIQGMKKARPDMDIFFDVENLRSGDFWESALRLEIERRDTLFLCWSKFAKKSKWVDAEWHYALENKGEECIEPIPLEPPTICPPPKELNKKHFNDNLLYIIHADSNIFEKYDYGDTENIGERDEEFPDDTWR